MSFFFVNPYRNGRGTRRANYLAPSVPSRIPQTRGSY